MANGEEFEYQRFGVNMFTFIYASCACKHLKEITERDFVTSKIAERKKDTK